MDEYEKLDDYEWAKPFGRRCGARLHKNPSSRYYGRCDLRRDHGDDIHVLERGMEVVEFKVIYEVKLTEFAKGVISRALNRRLE